MNMEQVQIYIFNIRVISINYLNIAMPMVSDLHRCCYNGISRTLTGSSSLWKLTQVVSTDQSIHFAEPKPDMYPSAG